MLSIEKEITFGTLPDDKITNNIRKVKDAKDIALPDSNCFGLSMYLHDITSNLIWLGQDEVTKCINRFFDKVETPKYGDVFCFMDEQGGIIHTAVYIHKEKFFHKRGGSDIEFTTLSDIYNRYPDIRYRSIHRRNTWKKYAEMAYQLIAGGVLGSFISIFALKKILN